MAYKRTYDRNTDQDIFEYTDTPNINDDNFLDKTVNSIVERQKHLKAEHRSYRII